MKIIRFSADAKSQIGSPVPIKRLIPDWYKKAETFYVEGGKSYTEDGEEAEKEKNAGLKTCAPFLDAMISGYALVTPFDIFVNVDDEGGLDIGWNAPGDWDSYISERPKESGATIPRPAGHHPNHMVWSNKWGFKAPRGYSILVTHPLNRFDLPFTTMSGIIDSDKFFANGNLPFFVREGFIGMIPEGTPIAQIIPIKRKRWGMVKDQALIDSYYRQGNIVRIKETSYKRKLWQKKEYN
jgi:hypothetical protein